MTYIPSNFGEHCMAALPPLYGVPAMTGSKWEETLTQLHTHPLVHSQHRNIGHDTFTKRKIWTECKGSSAVGMPEKGNDKHFHNLSITGDGVVAYPQKRR